MASKIQEEKIFFLLRPKYMQIRIRITNIKMKWISFFFSCKFYLRRLNYIIERLKPTLTFSAQWHSQWLFASFFRNSQFKNLLIHFFSIYFNSIFHFMHWWFYRKKYLFPPFSYVLIIFEVNFAQWHVILQP